MADRTQRNRLKQKQKYLLNDKISTIRIFTFHGLDPFDEMNKEELEKKGKYEDGWFYVVVESDFLGCKAKIEVGLNSGENSLSDKHVEIINEFLALKKEAKIIEKQLFSSFFDEQKWADVNDYKFDSLLIWNTETWSGNYANLCYSSSYDYEHGLSIIMKSGVLSNVANIQDCYFEFEKQIERPTKDPFVRIIQGGEIAIDRYLLEGGSISDCDEYGYNLLIVAVMYEQYDLAKYCITIGADATVLRRKFDEPYELHHIKELEKRGLI